MQNGRGWRRPSLNWARRTGKRYSRPARLSGGWWKCEQTKFAISRLASTAIPQLSAFLFWPEHFRDRKLDDAAGNDVAGLSADSFRIAARHRELRRSDCFVRTGPGGGRLGGAVESPQA